MSQENHEKRIINMLTAVYPEYKDIPFDDIRLLAGASLRVIFALKEGIRWEDHANQP